jgi:energy-coupling factor transport system permease protein
MTLSSFYVPRDAPYRRLSPPTKVILPLALMTAAFLVSQPVTNLGLVLIVAALLRSAAVPGSVVRGFAQVLLTLIPVITVSWTVFYRSGAPVFNVGPIVVTEAGLIRAVATDLRFTAIVLSVPLILGTMPQQDLVAALRWLRLPYLLCFIIALALRMIPTLERDVAIIRDAQRSRGVELDKGGLVVRLRGLASIVLPLMTVSIGRLEVLARVIESRGVTRRGPRSFYRRPTPGPVDLAIMFCSVGALVVVSIAKTTPLGRIVIG